MIKSSVQLAGKLPSDSPVKSNTVKWKSFQNTLSVSPRIPPSIHPSISQIFIEHLLCTRNHSECWGGMFSGGDPCRCLVCLCESHSLWERQTTKRCYSTMASVMIGKIWVLWALGEGWEPPEVMCQPSAKVGWKLIHRRGFQVEDSKYQCTERGGE